jgi:hypothetical protein
MRNNDILGLLTSRRARDIIRGYFSGFTLITMAFHKFNHWIETYMV